MADAKGRGAPSGGGGRRGQAGPADARARLKGLLEEIRAGRPRQAYLCFGDEFLAEQAAHQLIAALIPAGERGINVERFSGDALETGALLGSLRTRPLFGGRKVAAVFGAAFLASRESARELLDGAQEVWEAGDRERGARLLLRALAAAGVDQEEFADPGWPERLSSEPEKLLPQVPRDRLAWISAARAHCLEEGLAVPAVTDVGGLLEAELEKGLPADNLLLLVAPAVDQRRGLFKRLAAGGGLLHFAVDKRRETELPAEVLRAELAARAAAAGKRIEPDAAEAILQRAGASLRTFAGELEKLFTFVGDRPAVERDDAEAVFGDLTAPFVFDLTGALGERDLERALGVLHGLLADGAEPLHLLSLLAGEVRGLVHAREALEGPLADRWRPEMDYGAFVARVWEPAKAVAPEAHAGFFALHPYRAHKMLGAASRFSLQELVAAVRRLFEADLQLKTGAADPARVLELLLFDLCRPAEPSQP